MMDEDELIAPSPTAEDIFEEDGRFAGPRIPNIKVVDKNFFNGTLPSKKRHTATSSCLLCDHGKVVLSHIIVGSDN
jgi:hypothetical protein